MLGKGGLISARWSRPPSPTPTGARAATYRLCLLDGCAETCMLVVVARQRKAQ